MFCPTPLRFKQMQNGGPQLENVIWQFSKNNYFKKFNYWNDENNFDKLGPTLTISYCLLHLILFSVQTELSKLWFSVGGDF